MALQVTEKLLSACDSRKLQLIVDSYLDILHNMLETSNTELHVMATNLVSREFVCGVGVSRVCMCEIAEGGLIRLHVQHNELRFVNSVLCIQHIDDPSSTHTVCEVCRARGREHPLPQTVRLPHPLLCLS